LAISELPDLGLLTKAGLTEAGVLGVLDLDSPLPGRFGAADQAGCEAIAAMLVRHLAPRLTPPSG